MKLHFSVMRLRALTGCITPTNYTITVFDRLMTPAVICHAVKYAAKTPERT